MPQITRRIATSLVVAALILPISVSATTAQSSVGSGSDFLTSSSIDSKTAELEGTYRNLATHIGLPGDTTLERAAKTLANQATNGELTFDGDGYYRNFDPVSGTEYTVLRVRESEVDYLIENVKLRMRSTPAVTPPIGSTGIIVRKQGEYFYIAIAQINF